MQAFPAFEAFKVRRKTKKELKIPKLGRPAFGKAEQPHMLHAVRNKFLIQAFSTYMMNRAISKIFLFSLFLFFPGIHYSQVITNPSFEGMPQQDVAPDGWSPCHEFSTPDTQPGSWEVTKAASDGETYVGLVTRGDMGPYANQNEDVQTQLLIPLEAGETYSLSVDLSFSDKHGHYINFESTFLKYDTPAKLQVYGGSNACEQTELLWESPVIDHLDWRNYSFEINPKEGNVNYLILRAAHEGSTTYFGNVLIDNLIVDACAFAKPIVTQPFNTLICENDSVTLDAATPGGSYLWSTGSQDPSIVATSQGVYTVEVSNGCDKLTFDFVVNEKECNCEVEVPNLFTPNGDGINETFEIKGTNDIARYHLSVYNRHGKIIFETDEIGNFWDGKSDGEEVPTGVYYWVMEIQCIKEKEIVDNFYKGWVSVMR